MIYFSRNETINKVIAYARYSSRHQNPISIEIQLEGIRKYCEENGYEVVTEFVDEAKSGGGTKKRMNYLKMISEIENDTLDFDALLVYRFDRAGRKLQHLKRLESILTEHRKRFISVTERIENTTAGTLHKNIQFAVDEYEAGLNGDRSFDGLKKNAKDGLHCGGVPPLGYKLDEELKLMIEPKESEAVQIMFQMYDAGWGYRKIAAHLNDLAYTTKKKLEFKHNSIRDILRNEKYKGTYTYNKAFPRDPDGGNNSRLQKDEEDIIRVEDAHPAIVSKDLFERVQEKMQGKSKKQRDSKNNYILSGIIQCRSCLALMHGDVNYDSKDKNQIHGYYRCRNKKVNVCVTSPINRDALEDLVLQSLHTMIFEGLDLAQLTQKVNEEIYNDKKVLDQLNRYKATLLEQHKQEKRLVNSIGLTDSTKISKGIMNNLENLHEKKEEIQEKIAELEQIQRTTYSVDEIRQAVTRINEFVKNHKSAITRGYLKSYVKNILVNNDTVEIIFNEENECA